MTVGRGHDPADAVMVMDMKLHFENIVIESGRIIGGNLWFSFGERCFPEENWYEHVSKVLEMWLPPFLSFSYGNCDQCKLLFLDGPGEILLKRYFNGSITATCIWNNKVQVPEAEMELHDLWGSLLAGLRYYHRQMHLHKLDFPFDKQLIQLTHLYKQENTHV